MMKTELLQGNEACVKGALAAGCRFFAGYPITPASEIAHGMAYELPRLGGVFIQMEDEIASLGAVIGASLAGAKAMTATSGPGFSLMQEHIGFASIAEVPCVVINVMRGGPSTGAPTHPSQGDVMQARWGTHGDHPIIVLAPSSVAECFELTIKAFNLSERYRTPVIVLADEMVVHTREKILLPSPDEIELVERPKPTEPPEWFVPYRDPGTGVPPMPSFGDGYRYHVTGLLHDERGYPTSRADEVEPLIKRLFQKISQDFDELQWGETYYTEDSTLNIVAFGSVARAALRAVKEARAKGMKVGLLKLQILFPFMRRKVTQLMESSNTILVPEMNMGQISREVKRVNQGRCRVETLNKVSHEAMTPEEILGKIEEIYD
ncbi:MAG: 2-oxoacid:acceptor oxidoreductase subunit alpha [Dehalococcoidia bacterium]|nr:2-oxoacid:acceptor oxidoreductase subunit alpha [Dehalococcoidia bacterium]